MKISRLGKIESASEINLLHLDLLVDGLEDGILKHLHYLISS
jgi:hypothetical protein